MRDALDVVHAESPFARLASGAGRAALLVCKGAGKSGAGAVQPDPDRVSRAAKRGCELGVVQALPGGQRQQFLVGVSQARERSPKPGQAAGVIGVLVTGRQVYAEAVAQKLGAAPLAASLVSHDPPSHAVQPQPGLLAGRYVVQPAPGNQECLRDDISGVVTVPGPSKRVTKQRIAIRRI